MNSKNEQSSDKRESSFKVVDRRRFNENSESNAAELEQELIEQSPLGLPDTSPQTPTQNMPQQEGVALNFSVFVQSLAHQAFMGMGLIPWPDTNLIQTNFEAARETIDILGILQTKTVGNLDAEEAQMLDGLLYQLRMTFVKVSQTPPAAGVAPKI